MGNKMNLELKEGNQSLDIDETLIRDFQDRIYTVDKSMTSFVNAIDSSETACEILLRQIDKQENKDKDMVPGKSQSECKLEDTKLAAKLLWSNKKCVSDHKFVVLECLSKFIHLVIDTGRPCTDYLPELSIDKYRKTHNVEQVPFYDSKIENLKTEINFLRQNIEIETRQVHFLNEREKTHKSENELQRKRIEDLDKDIEKLALENNRLNNIIIIAEQESQDQSSQIDRLRRQETLMKHEHAETGRLAEEYKTESNTFFNEIDVFLEEIINANVKSEEDKKNVEVRSETQKLQNVSSQSYNADTDDSHTANTENDKTTSQSLDAHMVKIKKQLAEVKEMFEAKRILSSQMAEGEIDYTLKSKQDKDHLETRCSEMQVEVHKLTQELKVLKERKIVYVQIYFDRGLRESAREKELLGLLEIRMKLMSIDLQTVELNTTSFVQPSTPLLIIFIRTYNMLDYNEYTSHVVHSFDASTKMALVTFHRKGGNALEMSSDKIQTSPMKIGGIFDFYLKENSKEYNLDESNVNAIIAFIIREGSKRSPTPETRF